MDISKKRVAATGTLHLKDAEGNLMYDNGDEKKPLRVHLFGPGSKQFATAQSIKQNKMVDRLRQTGKSKVTPEQQAEEDSDFLAGITDHFDNVTYENLTGYEMVKAIYKDRAIGFIAEQVNEYVKEWGNFSTPAQPT